MPDLLRDRLFVVWAALFGITLFTSLIGGSNGIGWISGEAAVTVAVLGFAFFKVWMVMFTYMDLRNAPLALRILATAWLMVVFSVLLAIYFMGSLWMFGPGI